MRLSDLLPLAAAALIAATSAVAQDVSRARLIEGWQTDSGSRMIGVEITLDPGWKTYWRAPGGAGIPPSFDFSDSRNVAAAHVHWPAPRLYNSGLTPTIGYADRVVFPIEVTPRGPGDMVVDIGLFYGVCLDVCIPVDAHLRQPIAEGTTAGAQAIRAGLDARARTAAEAGLSSARCRIAPDGDGFAVSATLSFASQAPTPQVVVFETGSDDIQISPRSVRAEGRDLNVEAELYNWGKGPLALDRSALRVTLIDDSGATEIKGCPAG